MKHIEITKYKQSRFWAVWIGSELLAVVCYKKGALAIKDALINDGKQYRKAMQADQSTFARQWLSNLRHQGFETRLEQMEKVV